LAFNFVTNYVLFSGLKRLKMCTLIADSMSLRMVTDLHPPDGVAPIWDAEYDGFNYRLSYKEELTPAVQRLRNRLLTRIHEEIDVARLQRANVTFNLLLLSIR